LWLQTLDCPGSEAFVVVELDIADGAEELVDRLVEPVWRFDAADVVELGKLTRREPAMA
jgi:hypothetical protein